MKHNTKKLNFLQRKYLINKTFQYGMVYRISIIISLLCASLYFANLAVLYRFNSFGKKMGFSAEDDFYLFLKEQSELMGYIFLLIGTMALIVVGTYYFFLSHRIAGPLENIKNCLKKAGHAKVNKSIHQLQSTQFRKDDFFPEFAHAYNEHLELLKGGDIENIESENKILDFKKAA